MSQFIKNYLQKWCKFIFIDLSWDFVKTWFYAHILTIIPFAAVLFIVQNIIKNFYSCLGQPFQCVTSNYSEILLVIGLVLILLSIIINQKDSKNKFATLAKEFAAKENTTHRKFSETTREATLKVISKYYQILSTERKHLGHVEEVSQIYFREIPGEFNEICRIPEIVENEDLFQEIDNARNRAALIFHFASQVVRDGEKLTTSNMTNHDYLQMIEPIFNQFLEHKKKIFEYFRQKI
jgi:hypothetical protein